MVKKTLTIWIALLACIVCFCGCSKEDEKAAVIGKIFTYDGQGFGGDFTIEINEDGTFQYYEGFLCSYFGYGTWEIEKGRITLTEENGMETTNTFTIKANNLIWIETESSNFNSVELENGASFSCNPTKK